MLVAVAVVAGQTFVVVAQAVDGLAEVIAQVRVGSLLRMGMMQALQLLVGVQVVGKVAGDVVSSMGVAVVVGAVVAMKVVAKDASSTGMTAAEEGE